MKKQDITEHPKLRKFLKQIPAGTYLFRQGELGSTMFILLEGLVELIAERAEITHVTGLLEAGEFLGERAITLKEPYRRYFSAKATQPTVALEISAQDLEFLRITAPELMTDIMVRAFNVAARRLSRMNILVHSLRSSNNNERLVRTVLYLCRTAGRSVPEGTEVALSSYAIHYYIDMPIAEIDRHLSQWEAEGVIQRKNEDFFFVPDLNTLADKLPADSEAVATS